MTQRNMPIVCVFWGNIIPVTFMSALEMMAKHTDILGTPALAPRHVCSCGKSDKQDSVDGADSGTGRQVDREEGREDSEDGRIKGS